MLADLKAIKVGLLLNRAIPPAMGYDDTVDRIGGMFQALYGNLTRRAIIGALVVGLGSMMGAAAENTPAPPTEAAPAAKGWAQITNPQPTPEQLRKWNAPIK